MTRQFLDFRLWKETRGYSVWSHKPHTGDKQDCYGQFTSKREALRELKRLRKQQESKANG